MLFSINTKAGLTDRVSAFFLLALAGVLAGFSTTLYVLTAREQGRQVDERLASALDTLTAASEVGEGSVEWEPGERRLTLGLDPGVDQVRWAIHDAEGRLIDRSPNATEGGVPKGWGLSAASTAAQANHRHWRQTSRRLEPNQAAGERHEAHHASLVLTAGTSLRPLEATLRHLALALGGTSLVLWLLAAALGRTLSRRALAPLSNMAETARRIDAGSLETGTDDLLPDPATGDELEDLARAFNDLLTRLREAFARQRRFTGDASHQLRTPLAAVLGQIEVALRRERSGQEYRDALGHVQRQAIHLRRIVESLLFLARADTEAGLPDLEPLDLAAWLASHLESWASHPRAADLRGEGAFECPVQVGAHPALLAQALDNLIENALKYSPAGTPVIVRLGSDCSAGTIAVSDCGPGIATADQPRLFDPFYRSPSARRLGHSGVGLGLAIAQRIVQALRGTIVLTSAPGQGACFVIRLPRVEVEEPQRVELVASDSHPQD